MKSLKTLLAIVALSIGTSALVVHAEGDAPKKDKPAAGTTNEKPKAPTVFGEITKIDGSTLTISTKAKPAKEGEKATVVEKSVTLADTAEVRIDGEKKTVGDLKVGERARRQRHQSGSKDFRRQEEGRPRHNQVIVPSQT